MGVRGASEDEMDVKEAVRTAKEYLQEIFADEAIRSVGLEEVEYNDQSAEWQITLGFFRSWPGGANINNPLVSPRNYKVIRISDKTGKVISVKNREVVT
jgi:hypothetical protein